ncbi:MAG: ribonuclease H-like domain-containing protein [Candidatus Thermoplasmatota archaeon]|jgi:DNA polymerase I|nr:ribonuclease H-like domain-containing protein [Candidatus Thermoplasmatota archaeon]
MHTSFRIVAASYRTDDVSVELFGRTRSGKSVTALFRGFRPYFYVHNMSPRFTEMLKRDGEFVGTEETELWYGGEFKKFTRVTLKSPWKVPQYREGAGDYVLAADIPFHHRFIYDRDLGSCVEVEGESLEEERANFTTDEVVEIKDISTVEAFNPDLKVLSFDVENSIKTKEIYVIGWAIYDGKTTRTGHFADGEKNLLSRFVEFVNAEDPDVITGYNIDGYDMPLLEERMKASGIKFSIGRDKLPPKRIMKQYWRLHGRIISDTWWNVKKILHPKNETLNAVAKEMLGEGKDNINRLKIEEEWANRRQEVIDYCIKDAVLTLEIFRKLRVMDRNLFMATVAMLPVDDVTNGGTSNYVDSILIRRADREHIGVPMTLYSRKENPIEGGYVESIGAGLYDNVVVLDFKSMYPSMIMKYNICFTTLSGNGTIVAPNGVKFLDKGKREGLIPRILKDLMDERDRVKRIMKQSGGDERDYYDGIQGAIKILMNTFYGVLASNFYRFTNPEIGAAVTAYARNTIKGLMDQLRSRGYKVIYGDTDSIFIESGISDLKEVVKFGKEISHDLSQSEGVVLEFEKVIDPFFSHGAKKRYAGRIAYPEDQRGELLIRGYEVRRTDSFDLQSESLSAVFQFILDRKIDEAKEYAADIVGRVMRGDSSIPISKLVISRSVRNFSDYKNVESMATVRVARKLTEQGETFIPGMKVSWIVTDSNRSPQEVEPYIEGMPFLFKPDYEYYAKRVQETLNRVLEGINAEIAVAKKSGAPNATVEGKATQTTFDAFQ